MRLICQAAAAKGVKIVSSEQRSRVAYRRHVYGTYRVDGSMNIELPVSFPISADFHKPT